MRPADLARGGPWQAVGAPFKRRLAWVEHSFPGSKGQESKPPWVQRALKPHSLK